MKLMAAKVIRKRNGVNINQSRVSTMTPTTNIKRLGIMLTGWRAAGTLLQQA